MVFNSYQRNRYYRGPKHQVNDYIRFDQVRLIDSDGTNIGVLKTRQALDKAKEQELDLVIISEKAVPPVAKILDYAKFLYEEKKKQSGKPKAAKSDTKEFIFGPTIGDGDLNVRIERTKQFLSEGNRVQMTIKMTGRQQAYPDLAFEKINRVIKELEEDAKIESSPRQKGNLITVTFLKK